jgi:hypothetical protein
VAGEGEVADVAWPWPVPITPPKKPKDSGVVVAVAMVFTAAAIVGVAGGGGAAASAARTGTAEAAVSQSLSVRITNSRSAARRGQYSDAWLRMGLRSISRQVRTDPGCTAHSFGQVRKCFLTDPCLGLQRSLIKLTDTSGRAIVVSVAWVRMPNSVSARHLKRLVDRPGTGNLSPIADAAMVGVRFTGKHYASRRTGSVVVIAEAAAGSGQPGAAVLNGVAEVAAEFPSP